MRAYLRVTALAIVCLGGASAPLRAQSDPDPSEAARFRFHALRFTPSIAVTNVGFDNNVFNDAENPKRDNTAAVGPAVDLWLKMGRSRLSGKTSGQYLYFKEYDNQRSWNTLNSGRWDFLFTHVTPFVAGSLADVADRPGYEIDTRARHKDTMAGFGTGVRFSPKTEVVLSGQHTTTVYDQNQFYDGVDLSTVLNRQSDAERIDLRVRLTPLTTFVVRTEAAQDRFDTEAIRNLDSVRVMPGFELRPEALIAGEAFVGVRHFKTLSSDVTDFTGLVAAVKTTYTARATRIGLKVSRDLEYSYQVEQPYYALTDTGLDVTERVTTTWDLVGRTSWQSLAYRNIATSTLPERTDHSWQAGGGVGYRLGQTFRIGLDANYYKRQVNDIAARNYKGLRVGASVSYGLPQ
jgi:hypothetical protein